MHTQRIKNDWNEKENKTKQNVLRLAEYRMDIKELFTSLSLI